MTTARIARPLGAALAALALSVSVSACGGGDDRPSKSEVADSIKSGKSVLGDQDAVKNFTAKQRDCIAGALVDSDLSDKALNAFVKGDDNYKGSSKEEKALTDLGSDIAKCAG